MMATHVEMSQSQINGASLGNLKDLSIKVVFTVIGARVPDPIIRQTLS